MMLIHNNYKKSKLLEKTVAINISLKDWNSVFWLIEKKKNLRLMIVEQFSININID